MYFQKTFKMKSIIHKVLLIIISLAGAVHGQSFGQQVFYDQPFTTDPGYYLAGYTPQAGEVFQWDSVNGWYEVKILEQPGGIMKYAYSPVFPQVSNTSFTLQFDFNLLSSSTGMPMGINFFSSNGSFDQSVRLMITGTNDLRMHFYMPPGMNWNYSSALTTLGHWYRVIIDYDHTMGNASIHVTDLTNATLFYSKSNAAFNVNAIDQVALGFVTNNVDGVSATMLYDNILLKRSLIDTLCAGTLSKYWVNNGAVDTIYNWGVTGGASTTSSPFAQDTFWVQWSSLPGEDSVWTCASDTSTGCVGDTVWMKVVRKPLPVVDAGPDDTICEGSVYLIAGSSVSAYDSLFWSSSGSGVFSNPGLLQPVYSPSAADILNGSVMLFLEAYLDSCTALDTMVLYFTPAPLADIGLWQFDTCVAAGDTIPLPMAAALNAVGVSWSTGGSGVFTHPASLTTAYIPSAGDLLSGTVQLVLTAHGTPPCGDHSDTLVLNLESLPVLSVAATTPLCEGDDLHLTADPSPMAAGSYSWTGPGGFTSVQQYPVITGANPGHNGLYEATYQKAGCPAVSGSVMVTVHPKPVTSAIFTW